MQTPLSVYKKQKKNTFRAYILQVFAMIIRYKKHIMNKIWKNNSYPVFQSNTVRDKAPDEVSFEEILVKTLCLRAFLVSKVVITPLHPVRMTICPGPTLPFTVVQLFSIFSSASRRPTYPPSRTT